MTGGGLPGHAKKLRTVYEGPEWATSLHEAKLTAHEWDEQFRWAVHHLAYQPLEATFPFVDETHRLMQIYLANRMVGWLYFRIEPDDNSCTLLWVEARYFNRVG